MYTYTEGTNVDKSEVDQIFADRISNMQSE
jgi:hypothetical protein